MAEHDGEIIVGVLGQWASGKSSAAETLVDHLGGDEEVNFITDRILVAAQAVNHILGLEEAKVIRQIEDDGRQRIDGELSSVFLGPGEDLETVDLNTLLFDIHAEVYDNVAPGSLNWLEIARVELGNRICEKVVEGKPIVIEAGFGTNTEPRGENPFHHSLSDLFVKLEEAGVEPSRVKWIIIEADFERRSMRNAARPDSVPAPEFNRLAADGGDLEPEQEAKLVERGITIKRVDNNHNDFERFKADILAAYEDLYSIAE